jgi:hypothetical protein
MNCVERKCVKRVMSEKCRSTKGMKSREISSVPNGQGTSRSARAAVVADHRIFPSASKTSLPFPHTFQERIINRRIPFLLMGRMVILAYESEGGTFVPSEVLDL